MQSSPPYFFDASGSYRIRVQGYLAPDWSGTFCGMAVRPSQTKGKPPMTTLTGRLADQASLMGILTTLYEMGYALLDVKRLPEPADPEAAVCGGAK